MSINLGTGVSRVLDPQGRNYTQVIWQEGKPPLDSELNLVGQLASDTTLAKTALLSGALIDPTKAEQDFIFSALDSNQFGMQPFKTVVNGWVIDVAGVNHTDLSKNVITLDAPPTSESRTDFVFLEVWQAVIPSSSSDNKPTASTVWLNGNTQYLGSNPDDEIVDNGLGFETTQRVQTQFRIRVVSGQDGVNLFDFPEGLGSSAVLGQGTATNPVDGFTFTCTPETDAGLWRAGNGDSTNSLNTVDGYVYAIPLCAVFRRNSAPFVAVSGGVPNHNGSALRTPGLTSLTLTQVTLTSALTHTFTGTVTVDGLAGSGFSSLLELATPQYMLIDNEVVSITSVSNEDLTITIGARGLAGTQASYHSADTEIKLYNTRPDGLYADQIDVNDVVDLRHAVNFGDWDFTRLLKSSVGDLLYGRLHTTFKQAFAGSNSKGTRVQEVTVMSPDAQRTHTLLVDGPDGVRTIWSDASVIQNDITVLMDSVEPAVDGATGLTTQALDSLLSNYWTIGAPLFPKGFFGGLLSTERWQANSMVFLHLGADTGSNGLRRGFINTPAPKAVRFVAPYELAGKVTGSKKPISLKFISEENQLTHKVYGYSLDGQVELYPTEESNFERPFICLGGLLSSSLRISGISMTAVNGAVGSKVFEHNLLEGVFCIEVGNLGDLTLNNVAHNTTSLFNLVTKNGEDSTGFSSELYVVIHGDTVVHSNNGAFRVVGIGNAAGVSFSGGLTSQLNYISVVPLNPDFSTWTVSTSTLTVEFRTQKMDARDGTGGYNASDDDMCIVLTDLSALNENGFTASQCQLSTSVLWNAGHSALVHLPVDIHSVTIRNSEAGYLRNTKSILDSNSPIVPNGEISYPADVSSQLWNRLSSLGYQSGVDTNPATISFGGNIIGGADMDRDCEIFSDIGSKTLVIRPFKDQYLTLKGWHVTQANPSLVGSLTWTAGGFSGQTKDPAGLFFSTLDLAYALPSEVMPRFGRQDIPGHINQGATDNILTGLNHLFCDSTDVTDPVFNIIGGDDNATNSNQVTSLLLSSTIGYGNYDDLPNSSQAGALGVRKVALPNLPTSDLGSILNGLELPPYYGVARVYGVYEYDDFIAKTSAASSKGGFASDRITPISNPPVNLLRIDADKYNLFIRQGGGSDIAGDEDAHTYILTEHAIDIGRIPAYAGEAFADFDYVVECSVFGFASGFINKNTYVLARKHNGEGTAITSANIGTSLLRGVGFVIPSPLTSDDEVYVHYSRDVYQGDPFHTRRSQPVASIEYADAPYRYGDIAPEKFNQPTRSQVDADGLPAYDLANIRPLTILASMDFYLTLGTGCIGGDLYESTFTDVGFKVGDNEPLTQTSESRFGLGVFTQNPEGSNSSVTVVFSEAFLNLDDLEFSNISFSIQDSENNTLSNIGPVAKTGTVTAWLYALIDNLDSTGSAFYAKTNGLNNLIVYSKVKGEYGNQFKLQVTSFITTGGPFNAPKYVTITSGEQNTTPSFPTAYISYKTPTRTKATFAGGADVKVNGGNGSTPNALMGITTRLPLGLYVSDWDFLGEDILNDQSSYLQGFDGSLRTTKLDLPLNELGIPYTLNNGLPGEILLMCDGAELLYTPYNVDSGTGTQRYRIARGGGVVYNGQAGSNDVGGAPISWLTTSYPALFQPVLKGGLLACKALLVVNYPETAFSEPFTKERSYGDEIQLVVLTNKVTKTGSNLIVSGSISPAGFGEGYASADRYRIKGRPLLHSRIPTPRTDILPTPLFS